ncbi:MAG: YbhB/YbcL family Raf kinase inhibitor-like protein [Casimicrobiaceae bacterium]
MIADTLIRAATLLTTFSLAAGTAQAPFKLASRDFQPGGTLHDEQAFNAFGCTGQNVSPELRWSGAPADTKSFALLLHDPDAPTGGAGWWHWIVYNIPVGTAELRKGAGNADGSALPPGAASAVTDYGTTGYGGPCPPEGDKAHRYVFALYALSVAKLDVPKGATASVAGFMINANAIAQTTLIGIYGRAKR